MANVLTSIRIVCGVLILCFPAFSKWYYLLYLLGGFTDAIDGTVARALGGGTDFGARFDTAADFVFAVAVIVKIISALHVPRWLLAWTCGIFALKVASLLFGLLRYGHLVAVHSTINKVCGAVAFLIPLFVGGGYAWQAKAAVAVFACLLASAAAVTESVKIYRGESIR